MFTVSLHDLIKIDIAGALFVEQTRSKNAANARTAQFHLLRPFGYLVAAELCECDNLGAHLFSDRNRNRAFASNCGDQGFSRML